LFRSQKQLDSAALDIAILERYGVSYELLDAQGCVRAEPALGLVREKIVGGLRLPGDETGDCFKFTQTLATMARDLGVEFRYNTPIHGIATAGDRVSGIRNGTDVISGDAYVVALGSYSPLLLKQVGIRIPVYPVKGYSITAPITNKDAAPVSTVLDETYKVAVTRLGDRIRAAGTAELSGYNLKLKSSRKQTIVHVVQDLYPHGGDVSQAEFWCGLRPMTPDGAPIVGPTRYKNLYLNTGHGTLGWTMSCGSGRVVSDMISGRTPEIDVSGLSAARYNGARA